MSREDWSASAELNRLKSAGITGPKNPVTRRLANKDLLNMARTPGAMGAGQQSTSRSYRRTRKIK